MRGMAILEAITLLRFKRSSCSNQEEDKTKFDQRVALQIIEARFEYRSGMKTPRPAGYCFVYQFECISRNRLGYDKGMTAARRRCTTSTGATGSYDRDRNWR